MGHTSYKPIGSRMPSSEKKQLHLWPAGYGEEGIAVDVIEVRRALEAYWTELARQGPDYYAAAAALKGSEPNTIEFGDLAWAVLLAGQPRPAAAQSLLASAPIDISHIPSDVALEEADDLTVHAVADTIWRLQQDLAGFGIAIVVKVLHPMRPRLIPVIDRQSFFGSYFYRNWRLGDPVASRTAVSAEDVADALFTVRRAVADDQNQNAWNELEGWRAPDGRGLFTRIQLFDMLWWSLRHAPDRFLITTPTEPAPER